jgi:hypothetical protein
MILLYSDLFHRREISDILLILKNTASGCRKITA